MQGMDDLSWQNLCNDWTETYLFHYQIKYKMLGRLHFFLTCFWKLKPYKQKKCWPLMTYLFFFLWCKQLEHLFDILKQKIVNLQINKLGHYNNKLFFTFKVQQLLTKYLQQYLRVPLQKIHFLFTLSILGICVFHDKHL